MSRDPEVIYETAAYRIIRSTYGGGNNLPESLRRAADLIDLGDQVNKDM